MRDDDTARAALEWAGRRAAALGARVELVHVVQSPGWADRCLGSFSATGLQLAEQSARETLPHSAIHVRQQDVDARRTSIHVLRGDLARVLGEVSRGADVLVTGASFSPTSTTAGRSPATALRIAGRACCPVVVVADSTSPSGRGVVVGDDGRPETRPALDFAADEAVRRAEGLLVVRSRGDEPGGGGASAPRRRRRDGSSAQGGLGDTIRRLQVSRAGLAVTGRLVHAPVAAPALAEAARTAALLVVGTPRRRALGRILRRTTPRLLLDDSGHGVPLALVAPPRR